WQQMDFVVGIKIQLSNNHNCRGVPQGAFFDICDELKGDYPKDFKFTGWHPHCRCYATPILKTPEELAADNQRIMQGEEPAEESDNEVTDLPQNFNAWLDRNEERIARAKSLPYFLSDNKSLINVVNEELAATTAQLAARLEAINNSRIAGLLPKRIGSTLMYIDEQIAAKNVADAELRISRLEAAVKRHKARTARQAEEILNRWNIRWLERNMGIVPLDSRDLVTKALNEQTPMAVSQALRGIEKNISHSVYNYANEYAKRSPVIKSMLEKLKTDPTLASGTARIDYINEIKRKCAIITRWDLREATYGLEFSKNQWNWSMGDDITRYVNGKPVKIGKVYSDMIVYKDKHSKTFSYPVGATMDSIEFKANEASKILRGLPRYIQNEYDGFVFCCGRNNPWDKFYEVKYNWKDFTGGAYSGRITTFHSKGSLEWLEHTLCHEAGHNMDDKVHFAINKAQEWRDAVSKDGKYPTDYARMSIKEDIADSLALYIKDRNYFKKEFPDRARLIGELIRLAVGKR
ncbi:MAG: hypothetical protein IJ835_06370, partial [Muribaculaceae bacterium]|nr:hypothetical protein [Muribaculaceae bacterium]